VESRSDRGDTARWLRRPELLDAIVPVLIVRLVLLAVGALAGGLFGSPPDAAPVDLPEWLRVWDRWDGPHYLQIAAHGYDPAGDPALAAFLPLYPALIRLGSFVFPPLVAAMLISFVATLAASLALYALVQRDGGDRAMARRAVIALNVFPTSFALVAPYAEALFLALSIGALLAARVDRWAQAGVLGLLAGLARLQGWLLGPVLLVEHVHRQRFVREGIGRSMLWVVMVGLAPALFLGLNALAYGDPFFFLGQEAWHFGHRLAAPWQVIGDLLGGVARHDDPLWPGLYLAPLVAYVVLAAVAVWSLRSRSSRPAYATYVLLALVVLASVTWPISAPRYVGAIFPVFIALADVGRHRRLWLAWVTISAVMLVGISAIFAAGGWVF
jgi:Gpi18-like mannosyltransferase